MNTFFVGEAEVGKALSRDVGTISTVGAGVVLSLSLTKRVFSTGVGTSEGVSSMRSGTEDSSIMPMAAASRMVIPRMTATKFRPARFDSTYVSEKACSEEGEKPKGEGVRRDKRDDRWDKKVPIAHLSAGLRL